MIDFSIFSRLMAVPAAGFAVFLNFLTAQAPVEQIAPSPVQPAYVGGALLDPRAPAPSVRPRVPTTYGRTSITHLTPDVRSMHVPSELPTPLPTNAWWSSGVLEDFPAPLFTWPLRTTINATGLEVSATGVKTIETAIMHDPIDLLAVRAQGVGLSHARVLAFGDWDVTYRVYQSSGQIAYDVTVAQGSPYVFVRGDIGFEIATQAGTQMSELPCTGCRALVLRGPQRTYLLTVAGGGSFELSGAVVRVQPGGMMSIAAVPSGSDPAAFIPYALRPVEDTVAAYNVLADRIETTFTFVEPTIIGILPHHQEYLQSAPGQFLGSFDTVRGTVELYEGSSFTTSLPRPPVLPSLPPTNSLVRDGAFHAKLTEEITAIAAVTAGDVYAAGKQVLKAAKIAELARDYGHPDAVLARQKAYSILADWCVNDNGGTERVLAYDSQMGGVIPLPPAFGSEHFNDQHFHAGYFLSAGAIMARLDSSFINHYGSCMDLLIRNIASNDRGDPSFPYMRHFDVYGGHSWANGLTLFADAQNQESTSEALQAWQAVALWGRVTGNKQIEDLGTWLLAQEGIGTRAYWFNSLDSRSTFPSNFSKPMVSILWGGKADYATFFDASPLAIHGIQLFPVSTAILASVTERVIDSLAVQYVGYQPPSIWTATMKLVSALNGHRAFIGNTEDIDPVYSRSFIAHWLSSLSDLGSYRSTIRGDDSCGAVFGSTAVMYRFPGESSSCTLRDIRSGRMQTVSGLNSGWNVRGVSL